MCSTLAVFATHVSVSAVHVAVFAPWSCVLAVHVAMCAAHVITVTAQGANTHP